MNTHHIFIRRLVDRFNPPKESQGVLVFRSNFNLMEHLNLNSTPTKLFVWSDFCKRFLFKDVPSHSAAALKTIRTFPGLFTLVTPKCGKYQVRGPDLFASSCDNFRACFFYVVIHRGSIDLFIVSMTFELKIHKSILSLFHVLFSFIR